MNNDALFCTLSSVDIARFVESAQKLVCYAAPGVQDEVGKALLVAMKQIGPEMLTVNLDFDERVMRMGYGSLPAVTRLRDAGVAVRNAPGLRMGLVVVDEAGYLFTPTPLYLETEPAKSAAPNAMRMSREQVAQALARLSPAAKVIAKAQATSPEEKRRIEALPVDVDSKELSDAAVEAVTDSLKKAPPVNFDVARQVRVFEPYLQYVELSLTGAAIQRHRVVIPASIQRFGEGKEIEGRLRTTFELIEKGAKLSSKPLEDALNKIRKNFTPSLGKSHGRVVLKAAKSRLEERLEEFRKQLKSHQEEVKKNLQQHIDDSRQKIIDYYVTRVIENPPDALLGGLTREPTQDDARRWLDKELDDIFPNADSMIQEMKLEVSFKDVTYETLKREDFLASVKEAFKMIDWDKPYNEFKAAGEKQ